MRLKSIRLYQFRNFHQTNVSLVPGTNFFIGRNGQGKTNLVEAVHFLSLARSFRTQRVRDLISWGESEASVFGAVERASYDIELGVSIQGNKRTAYLNGEKASVNEYIGKLLCVGFSPDDLELVKGSPQSRRRFLDRHMVEMWPASMRTLMDYHRAAKGKNTLLKREAPRREMRTWNEMMAGLIAAVSQRRIEFVQALAERAGELHARFCLSDGPLSLELQPAVGSLEEVQREDAVLELLDRNLDRECGARRSLVGPHRDELLVTLDGKEARAFASQGQARSIVLSLKLGVIELLEERHGESPVVVLDDVDSELDPGRSAAFFDLILSQHRQVFVTGTDFEKTKQLVGEAERIFEVVDGSAEATK